MITYFVLFLIGACVTLDLLWFKVLLDLWELKSCGL